MSDEQSIDELRAQAQEALTALSGMYRDEDVRSAKALVETLRNKREYELMGRLAEAVSRSDPKDAKNRRLYAQYLIDTGKVTVAIDVLKPLACRLAKDYPEYTEATGLLGRAYKQIFFDAGDKATPGARNALKAAIAAYREPYESNPRSTWHGVNLVALLTRARELGMRNVPALDPQAIAAQVIDTLQATPESERDEWFLPTLAEASLGLRDWDVIDRNIQSYVASRDVKAFQIASTLRQFTEVWDLENRDERGRELVDMLRARLLRLTGGELRLAPADLQRVRDQAIPYEGRLEAILGLHGAQTYQWWKTGIERAGSVASVRHAIEGSRIGTGFLVHAKDFGVQPADELLVLTNFHVVNEHGASPGLKPEDAVIVFEAVDSSRAYKVSRILWSSPADRHDASLLQLGEPVAGIKHLPIAKTLPVLEDTSCVYIIGHPGGHDLAFSFQDNQLLDHEGPPAGLPQIPGVCRLHYRAPTEGGSSGSPVFNSRLWQVIALHHKGGNPGMPRLNGKGGTYAANEGIAIQSIVAAVKSDIG